MREYHKQQYTNKKGNLEKMDKFLERYKLPTLNQEGIENMNKTITSNEIEIVIQKWSIRTSLLVQWPRL